MDYHKFVKIPGASYEPEIFHALGIRTKGLYFIVYKSGKVVITGIKHKSMMRKNYQSYASRNGNYVVVILATMCEGWPPFMIPPPVSGQ